MTSVVGAAVDLTHVTKDWLIVIGPVFVVIGLIAKTGALGWFGHLPGEIEIKRDGFRFYFPLASMVPISIGLSLLVSVIRRFF